VTEQGMEKEVIILSTAVTRPGAFASDARRLNVALTRARRHLFIVGAAPALAQSAPALADIVSGCRGRAGAFWPDGRVLLPAAGAKPVAATAVAAAAVAGQYVPAVCAAAAGCTEAAAKANEEGPDEGLAWNSGAMGDGPAAPETQLRPPTAQGPLAAAASQAVMQVEPSPDVDHDVPCFDLGI